MEKNDNDFIDQLCVLANFKTSANKLFQTKKKLICTPALEVVSGHVTERHPVVLNFLTIAKMQT